MNSEFETWINLSLNDLESSYILYDKGHYRNSYFLFQQATEKANKALAIILNNYNEKELKEMGHNPLKIHLKELTKTQSVILNFTNNLNTLPNKEKHINFLGVNFEEYNEQLKQSRNVITGLKEIDLVYIEVDVLEDYLKELVKLKNTDILEIEDFESFFKDKIIEVANWIHLFNTEEAKSAYNEIIDLANNEKKIKKLSDLTKEVMLIMIGIIYVFCSLFFCAIITIQHCSLARYPENGENPILIYNENLPLIKKQKEFMLHLEDAIYNLIKITRETLPLYSVD